MADGVLPRRELFSVVRKAVADEVADFAKRQALLGTLEYCHSDEGDVGVRGLHQSVLGRFVRIPGDGRVSARRGGGQQDVLSHLRHLIHVGARVTVCIFALAHHIDVGLFRQHGGIRHLGAQSHGSHGRVLPGRYGGDRRRVLLTLCVCPRLETLIGDDECGGESSWSRASRGPWVWVVSSRVLALLYRRGRMQHPIAYFTQSGGDLEKAKLGFQRGRFYPASIYQPHDHMVSARHHSKWREKTSPKRL